MLTGFNWAGIGTCWIKKDAGEYSDASPLPLVLCYITEIETPRPSMLSLTLVPLVFLTLVSIMFSQQGLLPDLPTDSTVEGEWSWVRVRHRRATTQIQPYMGGAG